MGPFQHRSAAERLALAKERTQMLVQHAAPLFLIHEANAQVVYSPGLSQQIPRSYAAHAVRQFQISMHLFEIVRLCALWDNPAKDRESIPTVIALFNEPDLIERHIAEVGASVTNQAPPPDFNDGDDAELQSVKDSWWRGDANAMAKRVRAITCNKLTCACERAANLVYSPRLKALRRFRYRYIAHNLDLPQPDLASPVTVEVTRYGDETAILDETVAIVDALHHGLNQTAHDWEGSRKIARRNASELWNNCTFMVPHG
jgi:hypothetical protein